MERQGTREAYARLRAEGFGETEPGGEYMNAAGETS
jgi:hypothetical protein